MALRYRCKESDKLDDICFNYYGRTSGAVEQVLNANPGLAGLGPLLPQGTLVILPEITAVEDEMINIWE